MNKGSGSEAHARAICVVRRKSDGKIRYDAPDGTTRYITDEEWAAIETEWKSRWPDWPNKRVLI